MSAECPFKDSDCHHCGKKGHIAKVCRSKQGQAKQRPPATKGKKYSPRTHRVAADEGDQHLSDDEYTLFSTNDGKSAPMMATFMVNGTSLEMEVDAGASALLISEATYKALWPSAETAPPLQASSVRLRTYTGEGLDVKGTLLVSVEHNDQKEELDLLVVSGAGPSLVGCDWMSKIKLDWQQLNRLQASPDLKTVLSRHATLFNDELGLVDGVTTTIHIDPKAQPRFCKPRSVPYALRDKVEKELERLQAAGVIEPVKFSTWAAPIVPVMKRDGSV